MIWRISWSERALKDLERLDTRSRERVLRALDRLAETGHAGLKQLRGPTDEWRLRVGDWRVRLELDDMSRTMRVFRLRHRREAYRG